MISLDRFYFSQKIDKDYEFEYAQNYIKRPSWIKLKNLPEKLQFIKILLDGESFWYRQIFGNYFLVLEPEVNDLEAFYDDIAKDYDAMVPQNKEIGRFILSKIEENKITANAQILEMCAGTGIVAKEVYDGGYKSITLIDISEEELKIAKTRIAGALVKKADVLSLKLDKKYSVIFESMGFDAFSEEELKQLLKNIYNSLETDGLIIAVDRHIFPEFEQRFKKIEAGYFDLETPRGKFRYDYFIGKK